MRKENSSSMSVYSPESQKAFFVPMLPKNRSKCVFIANIIMLQCITVFIGTASVLTCFWNPDHATMDYDKLARIMYLFDFNICNYKLNNTKSVANVRFSDNSQGYPLIQPIKWASLENTAPRGSWLTGKTRWYIEVSAGFHCVWILIAIIARCFYKKCCHERTLKIVLAVFFYSLIVMIILDISMALVYISHIRQSLTKAMIVRHSGWSGNIQLSSYEEFAGWLPIAASCCWLRGVFFFIFNIYSTRTLMQLRKKIRRREIKRKYENERYIYFPEPKPIHQTMDAIVYRQGERMPTFYGGGMNV